jgi:paraquat-inducible protein B
MSWLIQRRLMATNNKLRSLRSELDIANAQLEQMNDEASDQQLRAMMSESPADRLDSRDSTRHASSLAAHRAKLVGSISDVERRQDQLLDQLAAKRRARTGL